jgi:hypothetical protein
MRAIQQRSSPLPQADAAWHFNGPGGGGAGLFNHIQLYNAVGSGVVLAVFLVNLLGTGTIPQLYLWTHGGILPGATVSASGGMGFLDRRRTVNTFKGRGWFVRDGTAIYGTALLLAGNGTFPLVNVWLRENDSLVVSNDVANTALRAALYWYEIPA